MFQFLYLISVISTQTCVYISTIPHFFTCISAQNHIVVHVCMSVQSHFAVHVYLCNHTLLYMCICTITHCCISWGRHFTLCTAVFCIVFQAVKVDGSEVTMWYKMGVLARKLYHYPLARLCFEQVSVPCGL